MVNITRYRCKKHARKSGAIDLGKIVIVLIIFGVLIFFASMINEARKNISKISEKNISSSYGGFQATDILLADDPATTTDDACVKVTGGQGQIWYICREGKTAIFDVSIINSGKQPYSLIGGMIVCGSKCDKNGANCRPVIDDACLMISGTEKCSIPSDGKPYTCSAGSYMFSDGTFFVYPMVICPLDKTTGCYSTDFPLTEPVKVPNYGIMMEIRGNLGTSR